MARVFLVRHGETQWNVEQKMQGQTDIPLNPTGQRQARSLGQWMAKLRLKPDVVVSSDLSRAMETAQIISDILECGPVHSDPAWREVNFGVWEGLTWSEIREKYPELEARYHVAPDEVHIPAGETQKEVQDRMRRALDGLIATYPASDILVVSHGGAIRLLLAGLLGLQLSFSKKIRVFNCSLSEVRAAPGEEPKVITVNAHYFSAARD